MIKEARAQSASHTRGPIFVTPNSGGMIVFHHPTHGFRMSLRTVIVTVAAGPAVGALISLALALFA